MATSRLSLTLFCPMNSRSRGGRSFSPKDESSSTGTAETMRSGLALSLGKGTQGDSKANVKGKQPQLITVVILSERSLLLRTRVEESLLLPGILRGIGVLRLRSDDRRVVTATALTTPVATFIIRLSS